MSKSVVGIDVSKLGLSAVLSIDGKFVGKPIEVENSENGFKSLLNIIKQRTKKTKEKPVIYLEATGVYSEDVSDFLFGKGFDVKVVNPLKIHAFGKAKLSRNKTDKADAKLIAEYGKTFPEGRSYVKKSPTHKRLKALYKAYVSFVDQTVLCKTHIDGRKDSVVIGHWEDTLKNLKEKIKVIKKQMMEIVKKEHQDKYERLLSIPGIGDITAIAVLAEIGDVSEFLSARQLAAYIGVTPRQVTSGTSIHKQSRISKMGNSSLRKALYFPAIVAKNHSNPLIEFSDRLKSRGKKTKQIILAVMRKLVHIIYGVLKNETYYSENNENLTKLNINT
jgi:transposase